MNKLKEINDRFYKKCEVVMLDSNNKSYFGFLTKKGKEVFNDLRYFNMEIPQVLDSVNQHLYFLSNEEIKEGDWFMNRQYMIEEGKEEEYAIWRCGGITPNSNPKKIIATTDTSLSQTSREEIPQPSKEFIQAYIKAYNEGKPITKVLVEIEQGILLSYGKGFFPSRIKVNSSNEVTIKKVKNSYTREEVAELCKSAYLDGYSEGGSNVSGYTMSDKCSWFEWLEENL